MVVILPQGAGVGADLEVYNTTLGYESILDDPYKGRARLKADLVYSPGGIGGKNDDEDFVTARADTKSKYAYLRFGVDREVPTEYNVFDKSLIFKHGLHAQISPDRLIGSERFINSHRPGFRGYKAGDLSGDSGFVGYVELETSPFNLVDDKGYKDALRGSVFTDFGTFFNNDASSLEDTRSSIFSIGGTAKYQINNNINFESIIAQDISDQGNDLGQRFMYRVLVDY